MKQNLSKALKLMSIKYGNRGVPAHIREEADLTAQQENTRMVETMLLANKLFPNTSLEHLPRTLDLNIFDYPDEYVTRMVDAYGKNEFTLKAIEHLFRNMDEIYKLDNMIYGPNNIKTINDKFKELFSHVFKYDTYALETLESGNVYNIGGIILYSEVNPERTLEIIEEDRSTALDRIIKIANESKDLHRLQDLIIENNRYIKASDSTKEVM